MLCLAEWLSLDIPSVFLPQISETLYHYSARAKRPHRFCGGGEGGLKVTGWGCSLSHTTTSPWLSASVRAVQRRDLSFFGKR